MLFPDQEVPGGAPIEARRLVRAWVFLATVLLAAAGLLVIPAALGAAAGKEVLAAPAVVRTLVGHVFFSLVLGSTAFVVVLMMQAALWLEAARLPRLPGWIGLWLAVAGAVLAAGGSVGTGGQPVLTEFVPVVVEPAFLSGFALFMAGVALTTGGFIYAVAVSQTARMALPPFGMLCAAAMLVATGLAGVASITRLFGDWFAFQLAWRTPAVLFQAIFWGPAHLIQAAVLGALVVAWLLLLPRPGLGRGAETLGRLGLIALVLVAAATLVALYALDPLALPGMAALNIAISDAQVLPVLILAVVILRARFRADGRGGSPALGLSIALFALGVGIAVAGVTQPSLAWVPAHYQALIPGAVLVAFMGVTTELLPWLGGRAPSRRLAAIHAYLYGGGIALVSLAMLWAALGGGERRGYFVTVTAAGPAALLWLGGLGAGLGLAGFAASVLRSLLGGVRLPAMAGGSAQPC